MFPLFTTRCLHVLHDVRDPSSGSGNCGREWCPVILPKWRLPRHFTCRKSTTWDRRLYFSSEGRLAEDFLALKNPTASTGFEPANLGTKGQHATPRPPKKLKPIVNLTVTIKSVLINHQLNNQQHVSALKKPFSYWIQIEVGDMCAAFLVATYHIKKKILFCWRK